MNFQLLKDCIMCDNLKLTQICVYFLASSDTHINCKGNDAFIDHERLPLINHKIFFNLR